MSFICVSNLQAYRCVFDDCCCTLYVCRQRLSRPLF